MNDVLLKLVIPGGSIVVAGFIGLTMYKQSATMGQDFTPPPVSASALSLTEVTDTTAAPTRTEPVVPGAPQEANAAFKLNVPNRPKTPDTSRNLSATTANVAAASTALPVIPALAEPETAPVELVAASSDDCAVSVSATARAAAMMTVIVNAPCATDQRVEVWHAGLVLSGVTNEKGSALVNIPAMTNPAMVRVGLADGTGAQTEIDVDDMREYRRVVLQTGALQDLELHVLEGDAEYDTDGHIHPGNPRTIAHALSGNGGFLTFLGDPGSPEPRLAQAYTFPQAASYAGNAPDITVEASITSGNCGQAREALALQSTGGTQSKPMEIALELPDCDASGELLILPGIFDALELASN